jgi:hypothetical protein
MRDERGGVATVAGVVALVSWGLLLVAVAGVGLLYVVALGKANGALQEATLGTMAAVVIIGAYVAVRCVSELAGGFGRLGR